MTKHVAAGFLLLILTAAAARSGLGQSDTRSAQRVGGLTRVPCGVIGLPANDDFCLYLNGYHWERLDQNQRRAFLTTYSEGIHFALMKALAVEGLGAQFREIFSRLIPPGDLDDVVAAVRRFYSTPENLGLPITQVLQLLAAKAAGVDAAAVENQTEAFRRSIIEVDHR